MNQPEIRRSVDLRPYNTFGLQVNCSSLAEIHSVEQLQALLSDQQWKSTPKMVLGGGSNVLFTKDFEGLMLLNRISGIESTTGNNDSILVTAGGGVNWHELVVHTVAKGWGGLENLSLIPGTVGAAPIQNIGAYGVEMKDTFEALEAVSIADGTVHQFDREACKFGYRDSIFKREAKGRYMITKVTFRLSANPTLHTTYGAITQELQHAGISSPTIKDISDAVIRIRSSKLPDPSKIGNAGSFFKNPEIPKEQFTRLHSEYPAMVAYPGAHGGMKLAAGWLIEQCGWKGRQEGNVGMHRDQALVLVNHGGASGKELIDHARRVQESVKQKFGVELEMEVNIL